MKNLIIIFLMAVSTTAFSQTTASNKKIKKDSTDFEIKSGPKIDTIVVHAKYSDYPSVKTNLDEIEKQLAAIKTQYETLTTMKEVIKNTFFGMYCDENRIDKDKVLKVEPMATELVIKRK